MVNLFRLGNGIKSLSLFLVVVLVFQITFVSAALCEDDVRYEVSANANSQPNNTPLMGSQVPICEHTDDIHCQLSVQNIGCDDQCDHCGNCHNLLCGPAIFARTTYQVTKPTLVTNIKVVKLDKLATIIYRPPIS
ncbi:hypothetical protein [Alteromonas sp. C1M14]|uniref:hypothetical protein n=1 Tax=Alteromonas sp. C1M14 TaxID=2841567 RepID=UPI001C087AE3|nr:hypothetical protein [Alteromonas sp. C1M14]MBU2976882.1 hypothetical protein [Alteromonas sp. C1M14]